MKHFQKIIVATTSIIGCSILLAVPSAAQGQSFNDVPQGHSVYEAAEYLKERGIVSGYDDGSLKPDQGINRAEVLTIIIRPLVDASVTEQLTSTVYSDVSDGTWFLPYVEVARQNSIIDGPPNKTEFFGQNPVIMGEFLKMMQLANKVDPHTIFSEISLPLSSDVADVEAWFYPYMRYALSSSMIMIGTDGLLHPGKQLTRGDVFLMMHRFLMYQQGRRTQALLSEAENEIIVVLGMLEQGSIDQAEYASSRALVAARGAHLMRSDEPIVQGAVKITEAFQAIVKAYRAGAEQNFTYVVEIAGTAWNLAARAQELSPDIQSISDQVQSIAKSMADNARASLQQSQR